MQVKKLDPVEKHLTADAPNGSMWVGGATGYLYIVIQCTDGRKLLWCPVRNICEPLTVRDNLKRVPPGTKYVISE